MSEQTKLEKLVSLCKRRGFIFQGSEIYGGLANTWDYGPLGAELKRNIANNWWYTFVQKRDDIYGVDAAILMNPKVWQASGHTASFADAFVDCKSCKSRFRADHLVEDALKVKVEGKSLEELEAFIKQTPIKCPTCGKTDFTSPRKFNLLFETHIGVLADDANAVYLRGETAPGMFVNFNNIVNAFHPKLPFGMAQIGKAFRNEITPGNFIFRTLEFEQMEIEYFVRQAEWERYFREWQQAMEAWYVSIGMQKGHLRWREHEKEELSHYSQRTLDLEYDYPFGGFKELCGLAYRTDFDLKAHSQASSQDLVYQDLDDQERFIPHVIEPSFGLTRGLLAVMLDAYSEEEDKDGTRIVLKFDPKLAPVKVAVFPLVANKEQLVTLAREIYGTLAPQFVAMFDSNGNIGKRYRRQDEIGTPFCITVDYDSIDKGTVTLRDRDTMQQERVAIAELAQTLIAKLG